MMRSTLLISLILTINLAFAQSNSIIAIVDDNLITTNSIAVNFIDGQTKEEKLRILESEINNIIVHNKALELNISHDEAEIERIISNFAKNNNVKVEDIKNNPDFASFRQQIIYQLDSRVFQQSLYNRAYKEKSHSNCSFEDEQRKIKLLQIVIYESDENSTEEEIINLLNEIKSKVNKGESLMQLAELYSEEDELLSDWIVLDESKSHLKDLEYDQISQIYKYKDGWAIAVKIDENYTDAKLEECRIQAVQKKSKEYYSDWVKDLRDLSYIKIYEDKI